MLKVHTNVHRKWTDLVELTKKNERLWESCFSSENADYKRVSDSNTPFPYGNMGGK